MPQSSQSRFEAQRATAPSGRPGQSNEPRFLEQVAHAYRVKHLAYRTEQSYVSWVKRFILFHDKRHPQGMGPAEVRAFLTHLAVNRTVSASTQNQALNAIVFMYREVLRRDPGEFGEFDRAKRPKRLPTVLTRDEVQRVLAHMDGTRGLMARLLYGTGIQKALLFLPHTTKGRDAIKETDVRPIAAVLDWCKPRRLWATLRDQRLSSTDGSK